MVVQQITILRTMYPIPDTELSNSEWLVQWSDKDGTHSKWFVYFENVSRFVENRLLGGDNEILD